MPSSNPRAATARLRSLSASTTLADNEGSFYPPLASVVIMGFQGLLGIDPCCCARQLVTVPWPSASALMFAFFPCSGNCCFGIVVVVPVAWRAMTLVIIGLPWSLALVGLGKFLLHPERLGSEDCLACSVLYLLENMRGFYLCFVDVFFSSGLFGLLIVGFGWCLLQMVWLL